MQGADRPGRANPPLAALLTVTASAFVAGTMLLAKMIGTGQFGPPLHPLQIRQGRFMVALAAFACLAAAMRPRLTRPALGMHALRSGFGWGGVTLMFAAAAFIPLSDASAISFLNPVFAMLLAIPLLGETVGRVRWSAALIALTGAAILLRPTPGSFQPAALLALAAALSLGAEIIVIKRLSRAEGAMQILLLNNVFGFAISTCAALLVWQAPTGAQWLALIGIGLLMATAQICFINAIAMADASFVSPFWYATLVFATGYDFAVFGTRPGAVSILGAAVILAGGGLLAWREARLRP